MIRFVASFHRARFHYPLLGFVFRNCSAIVVRFINYAAILTRFVSSNNAKRIKGSKFLKVRERIEQLFFYLKGRVWSRIFAQLFSGYGDDDNNNNNN